VLQQTWPFNVNKKIGNLPCTLRPLKFVRYSYATTLPGNSLNREAHSGALLVRCAVKIGEGGSSGFGWAFGLQYTSHSKRAKRIDQCSHSITDNDIIIIICQASILVSVFCSLRSESNAPDSRLRNISNIA
jgi:hypothetical protein